MNIFINHMNVVKGKCVGKVEGEYTSLQVHGHEPSHVAL